MKITFVQGKDGHDEYKTNLYNLPDGVPTCIDGKMSMQLHDGRLKFDLEGFNDEGFRNEYETNLYNLPDGVPTCIDGKMSTQLHVGRLKFDLEGFNDDG